MLGDPGGEISSLDDQALLGAAWISEIAEFRIFSRVFLDFCACRPRFEPPSVNLPCSTSIPVRMVLAHWRRLWSIGNGTTAQHRSRCNGGAWE